ncbi:MAG: MgtC/SapB family protein [Planctomycetota bacterium]
MELQETFSALGIALGLGLLIGMQRERAGSRMAGSRTFPLISLLGACCAVLSGKIGGGVVIAGFAGVVAAFVVSHLGERKANGQPEEHAGTTTQIAMLLVFGIGVLCVLAPWSVAVALGGVVLVLLHAKEPLHALAGRIGEADARAAVRFAILAMVVLPIVPDVSLGPYGVWNPRHIWLVVVLVVGIGLFAYVARRALGERRGALVGGLLGGMVSSTATTASVAREVRSGMPVASAVLIASLASAMVFPRQVIEIAAVAPDAAFDLAPPLMISLAAFLFPVALAYARSGSSASAVVPESRNPAALKPALLFAVLFAAVLLAVSWSERHLGTAGIYAVAAVSGLTDVDAITLSSAGMVADGRIAAGLGWRLALLAALTNLGFKAVIAGILGGRRAGMALAAAWWPVALVAGALIWLWPS